MQGLRRHSTVVAWRERCKVGGHLLIYSRGRSKKKGPCKSPSPKKKAFLHSFLLRAQYLENKSSQEATLQRSDGFFFGNSPASEDSLSDCETALACDDGSTFADDFAVAGGISGNGVPTPPGTTPTTARAFADPGTGHGDDAVCDDDEDPD